MNAASSDPPPVVDKLGSSGTGAAGVTAAEETAAGFAELTREVAQLREDLGCQAAIAEERRHTLRETLARLESPGAIEVPQPPVAEPSPAAFDTDDVSWARALLGAGLAASPQIQAERQQLMAGVRQGHAAALGLVGQLLLFRSAPAERLSPLLKDIGEAYYRWECECAPASLALRDALVRMLEETCAAVGLPNKIELVSAGDRFDSIRHNARERGAEVVRPGGWVVLRNNGKVYTKANVTVQ